MNNTPRNEVSEEYKLFPLSVNGDKQNHRNLLIRHDYYSVDSDHGRSLLLSFWEALEDSETEIDTIYLIDSGVKLVSESSTLFASFISFVKRYDAQVICCSSSVEEYSVSLSEQFSNIICIPSYDFFSEISQDPDIIVID